jgi:hypothetical protein
VIYQNPTPRFHRYITGTVLQNKIKLQLSTLLFSKTMVKKDLAASSKGQKEKGDGVPLATNAEQRVSETVDAEGESKDGPLAMSDAPAADDDEDVSSKAQIMVSAFSIIHCTVSGLIVILSGADSFHSRCGSSCR